MRPTGLGHGVYRDSIYPAKSRGDPEKTQTVASGPGGWSPKRPRGKAAGRNAQRCRPGTPQ
jgi:hypothetical protein